MTMKLRYAPASPFVRKVTVTVIETGQEDKIERILTDHHDPESGLTDDNPLGKVPALVLEDGAAIIESSLICAYLDGLHDGPKLIPDDPAARMKVLQMQALADGMADAAIQVQRERGRPEDKQMSDISDRQWGKAMRAMDALEAGADDLEGPLDLGHIAVACGLGWIEYRLGDKLAGWQDSRPRLAAWYSEFRQRPSMQSTAPDYGAK